MHVEIAYFAAAFEVNNLVMPPSMLRGFKYKNLISGYDRERGGYRSVKRNNPRFAIGRVCREFVSG